MKFTSKISPLQCASHQDLFNSDVHCFCLSPPSNHTSSPRFCCRLQCSILWQHKAPVVFKNTFANSQTQTVSLAHTHHDNWTSNTLESIVHPSTCHLHQNLLDGLLMIFGVDAFSGSEHSGFLKLIRVYVNTDDPVCTSDLAAHDSSQSYSSKSKHDTWGTFVDLNAHRAFMWYIIRLHHP